MRVSLGLPTHRVDAPAEFVSAAAIAEVSRAAEAAGYDAVFVTDHPAPPAEWLSRGGHHTTDPLVTLAFAAAATTHLRLQTNLFVPAYRHPLISAKAIATLDALSGGRVILGVGAGYLAAEFAALGADFDNRNEVLDASLRAMRQTWVDGSSLPAPAQVGGPPIWIGGNSTRAIRRAIELGDGWVPMPSPAKASGLLRTPGLESVAELRARIAMLRDLAAQAGRPTPLDVVFTPPGLDMFGRSIPDAARVAAQLAELDDAGVTWVTITLPGDTRRDLLAAIDAFAGDRP